MKFNISEYQEILCGEFPDFLNKYLSLKILARLKGIGLLCGTDWTPLFKNKFYYSRFDHSLSCALIVWNFTHDKKQTIAALLHDVSTPAFSHVIDFKNGDALKQESTEDLNKQMIRGDTELARLLEQDGISVNDVDDYHKYSVCDNEVPQLSADRLEYMFPSGAALEKIFSLGDVKRVYSDLILAKDERGQTEFAFRTKKRALDYFKRCLKVGWILQRNEDKMAMELLAHVVQKALNCGALSEQELYSLSEQEIIARWDKMLAERISQPQSIQNAASSNSGALMPKCIERLKSLDAARDFLTYYKTFRTMRKVRPSRAALPEYFCVNLEVKRRYINPLVLCDDGNARRLCQISERAALLCKKFLSYNDAPYGCVPIC